MAKKLFVVWLLAAIAIFSSISIYAADEIQKDRFTTEIKAGSDAQAAAAKHHEKEKSHVQTVTKTAMAAEASAAEKQDEAYIRGLSAYIRHVNSNVLENEALLMAENFVKYAEQYGVDEKIVMAVAQNESTYYSDAVSCENYKGLMQTGDGLAENAGYDPMQLFDPAVSIKVGARYLGIKLEEFGDMRLALTAYNQGSGSVHSGNYTTGYADLAMARAAYMEDFLTENGYIE